MSTNGARPSKTLSETAPAAGSSQFALLRERRFAPFFWTQFLGAFNDNLFKFAFTVMVTFHAAADASIDPAVVVNLIAGLFIAAWAESPSGNIIFCLYTVYVVLLAAGASKAWDKFNGS